MPKQFFRLENDSLVCDPALLYRSFQYMEGEITLLFSDETTYVVSPGLADLVLKAVEASYSSERPEDPGREKPPTPGAELVWIPYAFPDVWGLFDGHTTHDTYIVVHRNGGFWYNVKSTRQLSCNKERPRGVRVGGTYYYGPMIQPPAPY